MTVSPSEDLFPLILSFGGFGRCAASFQRTCKAMRRIGGMEKVWKFMCEEGGKLDKQATECLSLSLRGGADGYLTYKEHYLNSPCVPLDFCSIGEAVRVCPDGGVVTVLPGVIREGETGVVIGRKRVGICGIVGKDGEECIVIMDSGKEDVPLFKVYSGGRGGRVVISSITMEHKTSGSDIWKGNAAVQIDQNDTEKNGCNKRSMEMDDGEEEEGSIQTEKTMTTLIRDCKILSSRLVLLVVTHRSPHNT